MKSNRKESRTKKDKELRPNKMFGEALGPLLKHLTLKTQGQWNKRKILETLLGCCVQRKSIHSIQSIANKVPAETPMWHHLEKFKMENLVKTSQKILMGPLKEMVRKNKKYTFAIDFTDDPYYGKITDENRDYILGGTTKKSSRKFYTYASIYLIEKNFKVTLAALPVQQKVPFLFYVKSFIDMLKQLELKVKVLLLDKEFYDTGIITYLMNERIPHIIPVKRHGKEMKEIISRSTSGFKRYDFKKSKTGPLTVNLTRYCKNLKGEKGEHGRKSLVYLSYGIAWTPKKTANMYRMRFAIESSYRMRNQVRPNTSSRSPIYRYLMALISLLLKNVWEALRWKYFRKVKRGPPTIDKDLFRFKTFVTVLIQAFLRKTKLKAIRPLRWAG